MKVFVNPERNEWRPLLDRPYVDNTQVLAAVKGIMQSVKNDGDKTLMELAQKYDGARLGSLEVDKKSIAEAALEVSDKLKQAIGDAYANIKKFHAAQLSPPEIIETMPGICCWRKSVGIEKVGLYIPGGTAPLFSTVLMLAIPARLAACKEIILCTPAGKDGKVHPAILYAAGITGVDRIFLCGGAQAIAAMAYGTESIPQVNKIFGPGNQYVTAAKQLVQESGIAIDMPAGPSEVCVLADDSADPVFIAADLLSQAEHGPDSQVMLVTNSESLVKAVQEETARQLSRLPRRDVAARALEHSRAVVFNDWTMAIDFVNQYAPEHLIVQLKDYSWVEAGIVNAGSVFLGGYSPEAAGDYASGTNHTLPTNGFARAYSGVSVDSFVKKITYQELSKAGLEAIGLSVIEMAVAEGLEAHAEAIRVRLNSKTNATENKKRIIE
jgi:histidinol dehydrogenase